MRVLLALAALAVVTLALLLARPAAAHADDADDATQAEATRLLEEGTRLFAEEADWEGARAHYERSFALVPSWRPLSGLALVYQSQGRLVDALETYERLRRDFAADLSAENLRTVQRRIDDLLQRVGHLRLRVADPGARIVVDGREIPASAAPRDVRVDPGGHVVTATLDEHLPFTRRVDVPAGATVTVEVDLAPAPVRVVVERRPTRVVRPLPRWLPFATLAAGVVLVGGGVAFDLAAQADFDAFDRSVAAGATTRPDGTIEPGPGDPSLLDAAETERALAGTLYTTGAAAVVAGVVMLVVNQPRVVEDRPRLVPTAGGLAIVGTF